MLMALLLRCQTGLAGAGHSGWRTSLSTAAPRTPRTSSATAASTHAGMVGAQLRYQRDSWLRLSADSAATTLTAASDPACGLGVLLGHEGCKHGHGRAASPP